MPKATVPFGRDAGTVSKSDSEIIMTVIDALDPQFRALVYEFGFNIVTAMIEDGAHNAEALRCDLETWRGRRQAQWLATDFQIDRARMLAIASRYRAPRRNRGRACSAAFL